MGDDDPEAVELQTGHLGQPGAEVPPVGIAVHGGHRCDRLELDEDRVRADIAGVEDLIYAAKRLEDLGPEQSVGIGDDAESHAGLGAKRDRGGDALDSVAKAD